MGGVDDRTAQLSSLKLAAIVRDHFDPAEPEPVPFPPGAAIRSGSHGWAYFPETASLGQALVWAQAWGIDDLNVMVDGDDPSLARQALSLTLATTVWRVEGREIRAIVAAAPPEPDPAPDAPELVALLRNAELEVCVEHGAHLGEVLGLEVARVVAGPDGPELLTGVGHNDREASRLVRSDLDDSERLAVAVAEVRRWRHPGAEPHPLNRLARERWLRASAIAGPGLVGLDELTPVPPVLPRAGLLVPNPCAALGSGQDGSVLAVFSVGVALELVPVAAELAALYHPDSIVLVAPHRDQLPIVEGLVGLLSVPARLVAMDPPWPGERATAAQ